MTGDFDLKQTFSIFTHRPRGEIFSMKTVHIVLGGLSEAKHTITGKVRKCVFWVNQSKNFLYLSELSAAEILPHCGKVG